MAGPDPDPRLHRWWGYVPEAARGHRLRAARSHRWQQRLQQRHNLILILVAVYGAICILPIVAGVQSLAVLAVLPLLLLPGLGYLVYWLTWKEFHH